MKYALAIILGVTLLQAGKTSKKDEEETWHPFQFKTTEHFEYEISVKDDEGTHKGNYIIDVSPAKDKKFKIRISGNYDSNKFDLSTITDKDNIASTIMMQAITNPAAAPLLVTIIMPLANPYFFGREMEVGSHWETSSPKEGKLAFSVKEGTKTAGMKAKEMVIEKNDKLMARFGISNKIGLPLYVDFNDSEEKGRVYHARLTKYND